MSFKRVFKRLLAVEPGVVNKGLELVERRGGEVLFVDVRLHVVRLARCSRCEKWAPGYDQGAWTRTWRHLDFGPVRVLLRASQPRVTCKEHGVVAAEVPWARAGSRFTRFFEDQVAWLAKNAPMSAVAEVMRTTWKSVQAIVARVVAEATVRPTAFPASNARTYVPGVRPSNTVAELHLSVVIPVIEAAHARFLHPGAQPHYHGVSHTQPPTPPTTTPGKSGTLYFSIT